jgi:riboflavin kinase
MKQVMRQSSIKTKKRMKVTGAVVSGLGESASFLTIPWVNHQITQMVRFSPYAGTLNVDVADAAVQRRLRRHGTDKILPEEKGFCEALVFRGKVAGRYPCGVILPLVPSYPASILEIVAPVHLKDALSMKDGDGIEVEIYL